MFKQIIYMQYFFIIPATFIILSLTNTTAIYSMIHEEGFGTAVYDPKLKIELIKDKLNLPNNIAFLSNNDILIYEDTGTVKRISEGKAIENPLLKFNQMTKDQILMKAIIAKQKNDSKDKLTHDVFFYYVQCNINKECSHNVSSFELDSKKQELTNHQILLSIPSISEPSQINGIFRVGSYNNIYLKIITFEDQPTNKSYSENKHNWLECIIKSDKTTTFDQNFNYKTQLVQADNGHGLGYTFGTDYDPYSGKLWYVETDKVQENENISLVLSLDNNLRSVETYDVIDDDRFFCIEKFYHENIHIKEKENLYKSLLFLDSKALGKGHMNNLFVINNSTEILEFDLPKNRDVPSLMSLQDDVGIDSNDTSLFAKGFEKITDLQINPYDGTLYVVDSGFEEGISGSIFKIDRKVDSESWFSP